jgi:large subunit ribosomal protein L30
MANKNIKVTLVKSIAKCLQSHKDCVRGLGLRRLHHAVTVMDTPANRGMITKVNYLLKVEEAK